MLNNTVVIVKKRGNRLVLLAATVLLCLLTWSNLPLVADEAPWLSPAVTTADKAGKHLYIACDTTDCIVVFDTQSEKCVKRIPIKKPNGLALTPDGQRLFVTAGGVQGVLHEIDLTNDKILRTLPAGHSPESPTLSSDGKRLYYCNRFSRDDQKDIHLIDVASGKVLASAKAQREPSTMVLTKDGKTLWVSNYLPLMPANSQHVFATLSLFDSATLKLVVTLDLPAGSFALKGAVMDSEGKYYYVTHSVGRFTVPTTHLDRGWINTSAVSIFDIPNRKYINTVLLDDTVKGAANPWGVGLAANDAWLCVNASGTHEMIAVNVKEMMKCLADAPKAEEVINDLSFLYGAKQRIQLEGMGPRYLAVCGERVYSTMYYSDALNLVEIWDDGPGAAVELPLVEKHATPDMVRLGEVAFHDATFCYQQWLSCASCHPEVRMDATNWDLMNDGIGNPKQSRSLLYTHKTSPVMITGIRASAEVAVTKGFSLIQFHELPEDKLDTVNAFLKSLEPVQSPYRNPDGSLTAAALRGKKIFEGKASCIECHTPPWHSDKKKYVLGLGSDDERNREFATPILVEVWRTAPYMYDGRAVTIQDVITTDNVNNKHGNTRGLTPNEVEDLAEYVNSL